MWNPRQYARFSDERSRPFFELVSRINAAEPARVVDLGCGPGTLTATLAERWPSATVLGVDNDQAMLASANGLTASDGRLGFVNGDIATWRVDEPVDIVVSNAALQWLTNHVELLPELAMQAKVGGWFAFQVPGNLDDPHHQAIREIRRRAQWASLDSLATLPERTHVSSPATTYVDVLYDHGFIADAWETTYVHILQGADPVLEWVKGTGLRPVLNALSTEGARNEFCAELAPLLRAAYPARSFGTPFPFRRVFVAAQRVR